MKNKKKTIAVIPAFNEAKRIGSVISETKKHVDEVIVVDDHSKDNTAAVAKKSGVITIRLATNMGAGMATRIGCDIAVEKDADVIVTLDADGQHSPDDIPKLIKELNKQGLDIVFGSRPRNKNMPFMKCVGNFGLSLVANFLFGVNIKDSQTGFHAFTKNAYTNLRWSSNRYGIVSEFVANVGKNKLKYKEVKVKTIYTDKIAGMRKRDAVKSVIDMVKWRLK